MYSMLALILTLGLSAMVQASISSPTPGDSWKKGQSQTIAWDKSDMGSTCDIYLAPAGATDITAAIVQIAKSTSNSGSYSWTPDLSISTAEAEIIIVASSTTVISSGFWLTNGGSSHGSSSYEDGSDGGSSYDSGSSKGSASENGTHRSHGGKNTTMTYESHTTTYTSYQTKTKSPGGNHMTSTLTIAISDRYHTHTRLTTIQATTTIARTITSYTSIASPESVASVPPSVGTSIASKSNNTSTPVATDTNPNFNSTPTVVPFIGGVGSIQNCIHSAIGCVPGLLAMMLL